MPRQSRIKFSLPLRVKTSKKKDFILNLNVFRNAYFRTLSVAKKRYADIVKEAAPDINYKIEKCSITYTLYPKTKRRTDISNPCSIIDKFCCDSLTDKAYWNDDDYKTITEVNYRFGEVDKDNPRCEVEILVKRKAPK
tara:strand:- start:3400 stop:3813 length:414 start_codon:yes stop_codon:yes gene_type:complete